MLKHIKIINFYFLLFITMCISSFTIVYIYIPQYLIDSYIESSHQFFEVFKKALFLVIVLLVLRIIYLFYSEYIKKLIKISILKKTVRGAILQNYFAHHYSFKDDIIEDNVLIQQYVEPVIDVYINSILKIISTLGTAVFGYVYAILINKSIAIFSLLMMLILFFVNKNGSNYLSNIVEKNAKLTSKVNYFISNLTNNFYYIKSFQLEKYINNKFNILNNDYAESLFNERKKIVFHNTFASILYVIQKLGIIILSLFLFQKNQISHGELVASIFLAPILSQPLIIVNRNLNDIKSNKKIIEYLGKIQNYDLVESKEKVDLESINFNVPIIPYGNKDISFKIEYGKKYLIIGKNGVGKTAIVKKIHEIIYNHSIYTNYKVDIIQQKQLIDINQNIDELIAGENNFDAKRIEDLKNIVNFKGENSKDLSGGEVQKVSFMRVLYNNPDILIADEPFSSVDKHNYYNLISLLLEIPTVIIISHHIDFETLLLFDVVVFHEGSRIMIVEDQKEKSDLYEKYIQEK